MPKVHEGANRATPEEAASFAEEIDRLEQEREVKIDELTAKFKADKLALNKRYNADQKVQLDDAKKVGVQKGILKALLRGQKGIRITGEKHANAKERAQSGVEELESDQRDYAVDILSALGEEFASFGLGEAAVKAAKANGKKPSAKTTAAATQEAWEKEEATKRAAQQGKAEFH
jgi:hypothetical protein